MSWLSVNGVKAGQGFENCLALDSNSNPYKLLVSYSLSSNVSINNNGISSSICCDIFQCSPSTCSSNSKIFFDCQKIAKTIFCEESESTCAGIVGDTPIISNTTLGNCTGSNLTTVVNHISTTVANGNFANGLNGLLCFQDNGG